MHACQTASPRLHRSRPSPSSGEGRVSHFAKTVRAPDQERLSAGFAAASVLWSWLTAPPLLAQRLPAPRPSRRSPARSPATQQQLAPRLSLWPLPHQARAVRLARVKSFRGRKGLDLKANAAVRANLIFAAREPHLHALRHLRMLSEVARDRGPQQRRIGGGRDRDRRRHAGGEQVKLDRITLGGLSLRIFRLHHHDQPQHIFRRPRRIVGIFSQLGRCEHREAPPSASAL